MIKALIVDDEKIARQNLKLSLSESCPEVIVTAEANSAIKAIDLLKDESFDVVFLDINMPQVSGLEFVQMLKDRDFEVILVTAFQEYTLEAIKASVFDYLLKPIENEELRKSVDRLVEKRKTQTTSDKAKLEELILNVIEQKTHREIIVPYPHGYSVLKESDIILIEGNNNSTKLHLSDQSQLQSTQKMKDFEEQLSEDNFFRIHKSYLINLNHVREFTSKGANYVLMTNNLKVDISRSKLKDFHIALASRVK